MAVGEKPSADGSSNPPDTLTITRRSDLSPLYKVLRKTLRPLRPRLVSSKERYPAGSPRLRKRPRSVGKVAITERRIEVPIHHHPPSDPNAADPKAAGGEHLWAYDFQPPKGTKTPSTRGGGGRRHVVYYFAGGGFQAPASSEHWKFCAHLAASLAPSRGRVVLVSYPLAPNSPARDSLPLLRRWLARALRDAAAEDGDGVVSLLGDSAGANVVLSLGLWCADRLAEAKVGARADPEAVDSLGRLRSVLVISPPTDMRNQNPSVPLADARDPVLVKGLTDDAAEAWSQGSDKEDPYLSPNLADLTNVKSSGMRVNGVIGTADVLAPDALVFLGRCKDADVGGQWLVWEGQMHCFPLSACYGLREGKEAREWIDHVLREVRYG